MSRFRISLLKSFQQALGVGAVPTPVVPGPGVIRAEGIIAQGRRAG